MNMHIRRAGKAEHCRVGDYVTAVNGYKFGWGFDNRKQQTESHFQGQDTFEFQRIPKILRGHCAQKMGGGGSKDEEGMGRFRVWSQKREEQKEELKERGKGQRLREAQAVERNCMHVSFSCCASLCGILVITASTLSLSELVPGLLWYISEHLFCAICLLLMWHGGHWADACCHGDRNHSQVRDPSSDHWTSFTQSTSVRFQPFVPGFLCPPTHKQHWMRPLGVVAIFQPLPGIAQLSRGDRRINVLISLISHESLNFTQTEHGITTLTKSHIISVLHHHPTGTLYFMIMPMPQF